MFCYKCGKEMPDDSKFCYQCGTKQPANNTMENSDFTDKPQIIYNSAEHSYATVRKSSNIKHILIVVGIIAVIMVVLFILLNPKEGSQSTGGIFNSPAENLPIDVTVDGITYNVKETTSLKINDVALSLDDLENIGKLINLETLDLCNTNISDITPLKNLTNLKHLLLNHNNINDLTPISNLSKLKSLTITDNRIRDLTPLENLTNLTYLYLSDNNISDVDPLENLTELEILYLDGNYIINIKPLGNLDNLSNLKLKFASSMKTDWLRARLPYCDIEIEFLED